MEQSDAVRRVWRDHELWSETANRLKARIDRARRAGLWLAIVAAASAVLAVQVADSVSWLGRVFSAVAAIAAGLAAGVIRSRTSTESVHEWTRARSASEGLKSAVYQRLAGSSAYAVPDPDQQLDERSNLILSDVDDLTRRTLNVTFDETPPPAVDGPDSYVRLRVDDQIDGFYRPRAATYELRVSRLRMLGDALGVTAVVLGALATAFELTGLAAWVPVTTTASAAIVAHVAASRYDQLIIEYLRTADRLRYLRDTERSRLTPAAFVDACEDTISVENQAWMARWNTPTDTA